MKKIALTIILLLLTTVSFTQAQPEGANWTILHYMSVDNNLEGAALNDLYEMQTVGSGDGVNIVIQFDRADGFETRFGDWTDTRRFLIEPKPALPELDSTGEREALLNYLVDGDYSSVDEWRAALDPLDDATIHAYYENSNIGVTFDQTPVEILGEVDMGDPESLYDFLVWGTTNYPAEHYMVIIGSHGGGWRGIGPDEGEGESMLELPEISDALEAARAEIGIEKFDIVGFDACLMAVTDVAVMLESHADYVLFSQEVIPGNGWEYTASVTAMQQNPDWDAFQVGANFVDNYMAYYAGKGARTKVGLSLVETAGLPDLLATLENFAQVVGGDTVELLSALGTARNNSQLFGTSLGDRAEFYSYVDLRDFMNWFSLQTTISEDAYNAALEVIAAYDNTVVYALADSHLPGATGLSFYLPPTPQYYDANYPALAPESLIFWQDYLDQFYSTIITELDGSALQLDITSVFTLGEAGSTVDNPIISFDAAGKGVVDLSYLIMYVRDDGVRVIVDSFPISYTSILPTGEALIEYPNELTPSTFTWSAEFPIISDGTNNVLSLLQSSSSSGNEATVRGTYITQEGSQPAYLIFNTDTRTYLGMLAIADQAPYEVNPLPGEQFIVDLISITPEGESIAEPMIDVPLTFGVQPFTFTYLPAATGTYEVGLMMNDLAGNTVFEKTEVVINNDAVDGSLRGYTDINEGIYFQYPYAWGEGLLFTNEDGSMTEAITNLEGTFSLYIDIYPETDPDIALKAELAFIDAAGEEPAEVELNGIPAYEVAYSRDTDEGAVIGIMYSLWHESGETSVVITLEVTDDAALPDANAMVSLLSNTLTLFAIPTD